MEIDLGKLKECIVKNKYVYCEYLSVYCDDADIGIASLFLRNKGEIVAIIPVYLIKSIDYSKGWMFFS